MLRQDIPRTAAPGEDERASYYAAALRALRFVEHRAPTTRRFGTEADARWGAFRGNLTTADRIDLLLRDADAHWPSAFGARTVFGIASAAEDDAFGAAWAPLDPVDADGLWRRILSEAPPADAGEALRAAAAAWDLQLVTVDIGAVGATDRLLVAGPSAIAATVLTFAAGKDLSWADQVLCAATPPSHRQLAALAAALLHATRPTAFASPSAAGTAGRRLVASADADPRDIERARAMLGLPAGEGD